MLGTAGHIDHGKTALVLALTGTDTDRLPEEKQRGITVDLGFASMDVTGARGEPLHVSLVDVPGHHAFIRNMLAGAGGIDCVLLVIAATEGVKPQTREHLAICGLLGVRQGLVALTKRDLVTAEQLEAARHEVRELTADTFLADAPVIAVSAHTCEGIGELKTALAEVAERVAQPATDAVLRLWLDRAFTVRGFGAVVTGTLQAGSVRVGDALVLHPDGLPVRVRGVQTHGAPVDAATGPMRVALNLAGVDVHRLRRGQSLCPPQTLTDTSTIDVEMEALPGIALPPHRSLVRVHAFAAETMATVLRYADERSGATRPLARLRLREPLLLLPGDQLVLRQPSSATTVGGARVLDAHPRPGLRKPATQRWLGALQAADRAPRLLARVVRRGAAGLSLHALRRETGLTEAALLAALQPAVAVGTILESPGGEEPGLHFLDAAVIAAERDAVVRQLLGQARPGAKSVSATMPVGSDPKSSPVATVQPGMAKQPGVAKRSLQRAELASRSHLAPWVVALLWNQLTNDARLRVEGNLVRLAGDAIAGHPQDALLQRLEAIYRAAGLASPTVAEAAVQLGLPQKALPPLITQLIRAGKLQRMGSDQLLTHTAALEAIAATLRQHRGERFDVARFKTWTGLTRKHAMPLLEYLDFKRVFRNDGGVRTVL